LAEELVTLHQANYQLVVHQLLMVVVEFQQETWVVLVVEVERLLLELLEMLIILQVQ
jgi:hypothetical protein